MESNNIDNAICLNIKTGVYNRVRSMISGPEGTTIMFYDGSAVSFSEFSQDWVVDSEMSDEEYKEVSKLNVFNINSNSGSVEKEYDMDLLTKPLKSKNNNNINKNNNNSKPVVEEETVKEPYVEPVITARPPLKLDRPVETPVNNTITDLFSRLPDNVKVSCNEFLLENFPVEFIRDFIKYFNINKEELADALLNKYKEQFKALIIEYVCKENKD